MWNCNICELCHWAKYNSAGDFSDLLWLLRQILNLASFKTLLFPYQLGINGGRPERFGKRQRFETGWNDEDWHPTHQSFTKRGRMCVWVCVCEWHFYKPSDERSDRTSPLPLCSLLLHLAAEPAVCVGVRHLAASPQCLFETVCPSVT